MSKKDEVKEILNTLRLFFSLGIGLVVLLTGVLIRKDEASNIDFYFWLGFTLNLILMFGLIKLIQAIKRYTKTIRDLKWVL